MARGREGAQVRSWPGSRLGWAVAVTYVGLAAFLFYRALTCTGWVCDLVALPAAFPLGFPIGWLIDWIDFRLPIPGHTPTFHFRNWYYIIPTVITNAVFYYWTGKLVATLVRRLRAGASKPGR